MVDFPMLRLMPAPGNFWLIARLQMQL